MIREMSVHPKPSNNKAKIAAAVSGIVTIAGFAVYFIADRYKSLIGLVALGALVTALLFVTKYLIPVFIYDVMIAEDGTPLFIVRQKTGKRERTLCRIELAGISDIKTESAAERKKHKTPTGVVKYSYAPSLAPSVSSRIVYTSRYEKCEIIIEASEEYIDVLRAYAAEARAERAAREAEEEE